MYFPVARFMRKARVFLGGCEKNVAIEVARPESEVPFAVE